MALVNMRDMLYHAYHSGYAIGAFDLVSLDFLEGIIVAAERCRSPVILSLAESHFDYFDVELIMPAVETAARRSSVPIAIHLDHGTNITPAIRAINLGCNSVMVDTSHKSFSDNVHSTRAVVGMAHACGVPVEGELGYVPGVEGEDAERHPGEITYTTAEEAWCYVDQTGVDFLAVSIGTVHGRMKGKPKLDYHRLKQINQALNIPLVIHGGTGLSDDQFRRLITNGVAKINYYTALADAASSQIIINAMAKHTCSHTDLMKGVRKVIANEVERCMNLFGSTNRAEELLEKCEPWMPVEHLIVYNVTGITESEVDSMMDEGRRSLQTIPGVSKVATGKAIKEAAEYQYCWLVSFVHPSVIDSYQEHPAHVAFADKLFRPVASDRISIDYQTIESASTQGIFNSLEPTIQIDIQPRNLPKTIPCAAIINNNCAICKIMCHILELNMSKNPGADCRNRDIKKEV